MAICNFSGSLVYFVCLLCDVGQNVAEKPTLYYSGLIYIGGPREHT